EPVYLRDGAEGFDGLARAHQAPVIVLTAAAAPVVAQAYEHGVAVWLPRDLAIQGPDLLAAALEQAARLGQLQRTVRRLDDSLRRGRPVWAARLHAAAGQHAGAGRRRLLPALAGGAGTGQSRGLPWTGARLFRPGQRAGRRRDR